MRRRKIRRMICSLKSFLSWEFPGKFCYSMHMKITKTCVYVCVRMQRALSTVYVQKGVMLIPEYCLSLNQITPITNWPLQVAIIPWLKLRSRRKEIPVISYPKSEPSWLCGWCFSLWTHAMAVHRSSREDRKDGPALCLPCNYQENI